MVRATVHTCKDCNKDYASYQSLCNHRTKKHITSSNSIEQHKTALNNIHIREFNCRKCNKSYKHQQSRSRHEKICKNTNQEIIEKNDLIKKCNIIENNGTINNTNNGTINNTNNITNNITINNYGKEDTSYVSEKFMLNIIRRLIKNDESSKDIMPHLIKNIYFNEYHKDNNNLQINNIRSPIAKVYKDDKWLYIDKNKIIKETHDNSVNFTENWANINKEIVPKNTKDKIKDYKQIHSKQYDNKKEIFDEITKLAYIYYKNHIENNVDF
jgi:hypothetical protein